MSRGVLLKDSLFTCLCLIISYFIYTNLFLDMDVAWHVEGARRLISGGDYLTSVFDDNSPFVFAVFFPVIFIHPLLPISYGNLIVIYLLILTSFSLSICYYVFAKSISNFGEDFNYRYLYYALVFAEFFLPLISFGHREIILIDFAIPYFFVLVFSTTHVKECQVGLFCKIVCVLLASFAIMQNIFYVAIFIVLDIYKYLLVKKFESFQAFFYFFISSQIAITFLIYPSYINVIIPMVLCYEQGFNDSFFNVAFKAYSFLCLATLMLFVVNIKKLINHKEITMTFLALAGTWLIYFFEKKIWYNHVYPCLVFAILLNVMLLTRNRLLGVVSKNFLKLNLASSSLAAAILFIIGMMILIMLTNHIHDFYDQSHPWNKWIAYTNKHFKNKTLFYFTLYDPPGYLLPLYTEAKVVSPWLNPWFMPYFLQLKDGQRGQICNINRDIAIINQLFLESFTNTQPDFVLIAIPSDRDPKQLTYLKNLSEEGIQKLLANYYFYDIYQNIKIYKKR